MTSSSSSSGGDELKVPSQRAEEVPADEERDVANEGRDPTRDDDDDFRDERDRPADDRYARTRHDDDDLTHPVRAEADDDEYADADERAMPDSAPGAIYGVAPGAVPSAVTAPPANDESPYRDPYAGTSGGDMLAEPQPESQPQPQERVPDPAHAGVPDDEIPADEVPDDKVPADEVPAHAAPQDVFLFDQDPAQVQSRWRELQSSFVDDPSEAIQRADGLVGEVVDTLTSSLTSRTDALRQRWKDVDSPDTEDLRLALRDYRSVLERLLALSTHASSGQSQESR